MKIVNNIHNFKFLKQSGVKISKGPLNPIGTRKFDNLSPLKSDTLSFGSKIQGVKKSIELTAKELVAASVRADFSGDVDKTAKDIDKAFVSLADEGVELSVEDIIEIAKRCDFSPEIINELSNSKNFFAKAFVLNQMLSTSPNITGVFDNILKTQGNVEGYKIACGGYFNLMLELGSKNFKHLELIKTFVNEITQGKIDTASVKNAINNEDLFVALVDLQQSLCDETVAYFAKRCNNDEKFSSLILNPKCNMEYIKQYLERTLKSSEIAETVGCKNAIKGTIECVQAADDPLEYAIDEYASLLADLDSAQKKLNSQEVLKFQQAKGLSKKQLLDFIYLNDSSYKTFRTIVRDEDLLKTLDAVSIYELSSANADDFKPVVELIKKGHFIDSLDALDVCGFEPKKALYKKFLSKGVDGKTSVILANIDRISRFPEEKLEDLIELMGLIGAQKPSKTRTSEALSEFLMCNKNIDLKEFNNYIKTIDFEAIAQFAPDVKEFQAEQFLTFAKYHYKNGTRVFDQESLNFDKTNNGGLTQHLAENYLNSDMLSDLFSIFPATSRKVGEIPKDWIDENIADKTKAQELVYEAIEIFQQNGDTKELGARLGMILGKKTNVSKIGSGTYGDCYKISAQGIKPVSLKVFTPPLNEHTTRNIHGQHIEPQVALFVNENSQDFVKMYFGKVSPYTKNDGFMVCQFLEKGIVPENTGAKSEIYDITCVDARGGKNTIIGKIIDFGGIFVKKIQKQF